MKVNGTPRYTVIMHDVREKYNMTLTEYAIADSIYHLQNNDKHLCTAGKEYLGNFVGIQRRMTINIINKLVEKGLVTRQGNHLRTTKQWDENYKIKKRATNAQQVRNNCTVESAQIAHDKNLIKTNISSVEAKSLLHYLNEKKPSDKDFKVIHRFTSNALKKYTLEDLKKIVDFKVKEWGEDPVMKKYLRQETLFCASHLDTYLTEAEEDESKGKLSEW